MLESISGDIQMLWECGDDHPLPPIRSFQCRKQKLKAKKEGTYLKLIVLTDSNKMEIASFLKPDAQEYSWDAPPQRPQATKHRCSRQSSSIALAFLSLWLGRQLSGDNSAAIIYTLSQPTVQLLPSGHLGQNQEREGNPAACIKKSVIKLKGYVRT